jgi:pyruvate dehydrogenase E2 component (dihydrolipoamide acetyltransferase)
LARKIAAERHVDLSTVTGTGAGGAITRADVEAARPDAAAGDAKHAMRQAVAAAVAKSKREIPHYYLATDVDLTRALAWLTGINRDRSIEERILPAALLLKAAALSAKKFADLNGHWVDGGFRPGDGVHLSVMISLRLGGLLAPAIRDADTLRLPDLMRSLRDLVRRARDGGLRGSEMSGGTIGVSNLGDTGVDAVQGVIYPPQVALVGFGRVRERPWADQGMLDVRSVVTATLAGDHRATDGHYGGQYLTEVARLLADPEALA